MKEKKNNNNVAVIVVAVLLSFVSGTVGSYLVITNVPSISKSIVENVSKLEITENSIAPAVNKVYDAVVAVMSYKQDELLATGTGFAYKEDDGKVYIMTNNHVISGADKVTLILSNSDQVEATIVGGETYSDIAVLSIDKNDNLGIAEIGDSTEIQLGDTVFTVGSPMGIEYSGTVTKGILSGKDRLVEVSFSGSTSDYYMKVLQTDAAINPGNSGGPLVNINGEVIGINSLKLVEDKIEGMGFAIPIETALEYAESFISGKQIERPYLGISMYDLETNSLFRPNNSSNITEGIYINSVENGGPAAAAGLGAGDIITAIDDVKVSSSAYFRYQLYQHDVGDEIKITYYRNNQEQTTTVKLTSTQPTT